MADLITSNELNSTSTYADVHVELYTLIVCTLVMLGFGFVGLLVNVGLLISVRCMSPSATKNNHGLGPGLYYALPCSLAVVNLLFSLLWVPLDVMRLLLNYNRVALHHIACYADISLFVFCVSAIVILTLFFALQRCTKHYSIEIAHGTFVSTAIVVTLILGIVCTGCVLATYSYSIDYQLCVQEEPFQVATLYQVMPVIGIICFLLLLLIIAIYLFCTILWRQRCKLAVYRRTRCRHNRKISDAAGLREASQEAQERFLEPSSDVQDSRSSRKSSKAASGSSSRQLICIKDNSEGATTDQKSGGDSDDDDFDQKMKLRLQKSLSGRRHTVANISLGLTSSLNKASSQDSVNRSPSPFNYQYVRKWSVDIQALQDQLENPKGLLGAHPFGLGGSFKREKHEPSNQSIEEKPEHEDLEEENSKATGDKSEINKIDGAKPRERKLLKEKVDRTKSDQSGVRSKDSQTVGVKFDTIVKTSSESKCDKVLSSSGSEVRFQDTIEEHVEDLEHEEQLKCDNEVKSVCIQETTKDSIIEEDETEPDGILTFPEPDCNKSDKVANGNRNDNAPTDLSSNQPDAANDGDLELLTIQCIKDITQEMQINTIVLLLLLTVISCIAPYSILQIFQWTIDYSFNRNLSWMLAGIVLVQMPLHVLLLAWMERPLWKAMRRLWIKLTHWRCVCYCNIGKGKHCFQRPGYREANPAV